MDTLAIGPVDGSVYGFMVEKNLNEMLRNGRSNGDHINSNINWRIGVGRASAIGMCAEFISFCIQAFWGSPRVLSTVFYFIFILIWFALQIGMSN